MLRAKVFINLDELEDIQIVNTLIQNKKGEYKYKVNILGDSFTVFHAQSDGWIKLMIKVLRKMQKRTIQIPMEAKKGNEDDLMIAKLLKEYKETYDIQK